VRPKGAVLTQYNIVATAFIANRWCSAFVDNQTYDRRPNSEHPSLYPQYGEAAESSIHIPIGTIVILAQKGY
jgi:hypothetical protein